jgi:hypothetical protein
MTITPDLGEMSRRMKKRSERTRAGTIPIAYLLKSRQLAAT